MRNFICLYIVVVCLVATACSKENSDIFIPYAGNPANDTSWSTNVTPLSVSNRLFDGLVLTPFIDSFDVTGSALLHVSATLDMAIPASSLLNEDGSAVTPGKVSTEIRHLNRRGDFIRYARPTTSYGKIMESVSAFQVSFYRQDRKLKLKPGKKLFFTLLDPAPAANTSVYFGNTELSLPLPPGTNPFFNWSMATDSSFAIPFTRQDSNGVTKGYQVFAGNCDWINAQHLLDTVLPRTRINVTLPANFTNDNTAVFAVIKQRKAVVQLNPDYASRSFFAPDVPLGNTIIIVSLSLIGKQYYLGFKEMTATPNLITIINPAASTKATINQFLNGI